MIDENMGKRMRDRYSTVIIKLSASWYEGDYMRVKNPFNEEKKIHAFQ